MSADLHIHVFEGITEEDIKVFFSNHLGSKHFTMQEVPWEIKRVINDKVTQTPDVWIGEVSWLKAALYGDAETFVPDPVGEIFELIGEDLPVLTPKLRDQILAALNINNETNYEVSEQNSVAEFLSEHMGKQLFTVSW